MDLKFHEKERLLNDQLASLQAKVESERALLEREKVVLLDERKALKDDEGKMKEAMGRLITTNQELRHDLSILKAAYEHGVHIGLVQGYEVKPIEDAPLYRPDSKAVLKDETKAFQTPDVRSKKDMLQMMHLRTGSGQTSQMSPGVSSVNMHSPTQVTLGVALPEVLPVSKVGFDEQALDSLDLCAAFADRSALGAIDGGVGEV
ncbi:hypothetical protein L1987_49268 [Smallanthus sonchifolius]|uniref:Uncharacterized protein n=1 Tax=Smallanthus sonchifolius TaxID=185202 RepID=A0ACB9FV94_9ASTR|nr:hypothetical protein L1987_49268 [Smallanthus sonchifolius]